VAPSGRMVQQQHRVMATGSRGSSGSGAQPLLLEQHILKRRAAEERRLAFWPETSGYYDRVAKESSRHSALSSEGSRRASPEAAGRERAGEVAREQLAGRSRRLGELLAREAREEEEQLARYTTLSPGSCTRVSPSSKTRPSAAGGGKTAACCAPGRARARSRYLTLTPRRCCGC
jgi:hypothetical protein